MSVEEAKGFVKKERVVDSLLHLKTTNKKLIICTVGVPARGKTYISKRLSRYLTWLGYKARVFNVGTYRREIVGTVPAEFFDPHNQEGEDVRKQCAIKALNDMSKFLSEGGHVAILDGTNTTRTRRNMIKEFFMDTHLKTGELIWVESICTDKSIVERNVEEMKMNSPDYSGVAGQKALDDFRARIAAYEKNYETLAEDQVAPENEGFIKLFNVGKSVVAHHVNGYLPSKILFFLMNLQIHKKPIYLSRHGESVFNVQGKIGGDSSLSEHGREYAEALGKFIREQPAILESKQPLSIWCSTLKRTIETTETVVQMVPELVGACTKWRALSEIEAGACDGLTYEQVAEKDPIGFAARKADKLRYRYPQGESYLDVIQRIEPVIFELERVNVPILVVAHQAVLRCIYGYFMEEPLEAIPFLSVPLHTVMELLPNAYGVTEKRYMLMTSDEPGSDKMPAHSSKQTTLIGPAD